MSDFTIHPVYLSARAAIVAPERAIPVTLYAAQKWLPRLGPERWCLVLLLRSLCIDSKRRSDGTKRIACSWRQLAELLDVHEETVASWLKHKPIPNDKPWRRIIPVDDKARSLALFIPRLRYAYETQNGKTRRIGFLLEVLMEDPVVPEDEIRLHKQMELLRLQQGELGLETYRIDETVNAADSDLLINAVHSHRPSFSDSRYVNQQTLDLPSQANPKESHSRTPPVNPKNLDLPPTVKQHNVGTEDYVNQVNPSLPDDKSAFSGKNVNELDKLIQKLKQSKLKKNIRKEFFEPIVQLTENLLADTHSTGMLYKVLSSLYPERLDLFVAAVRVALDVGEDAHLANRGAIFVRAVREFADVAGVDLGLKRASEPSSAVADAPGNPGSQLVLEDVSSLAAPLASEAIWAETQLALRRQMTQATYNAIIQGTVLLFQDKGRYVIGVNTEMARDWLENRLRDIVQRSLSSVVGTAVEIEFRLLNEPN